MNKCFQGWPESSAGRCCCNCKFRLTDYLHCTTVGSENHKGCVCSVPKGFICIGLEGRAYSGWTEHGMCELHIWKDIDTEP